MIRFVFSYIHYIFSAMALTKIMHVDVFMSTARVLQRVMQTTIKLES